ncbi:DUF1761 domain-containing protein [Flavobacterium jejuense]|uniref:DUF1761 domain-containing protein n=1 Tax=Flavobacterium jejuense TaxID=1544455 RepID=A0ABX0IY03_9FLAO|nr:DUF1761 domain-containing protein [Flavobacterium jejuense]NHN27709.1 DUF1761 domain-containing protein [Flavobacterium jejuense]
MDSINWFSMVIATIIPVSFGFIYYKIIFGNIWLDSIGIVYKKKKKTNMIIIIGVSIILSFFLSFFLLNFNNSGIDQEGGYDTFQHGAWHGTFIAITVVSPVIVMNGLFSRKSWKNMLINILYWIITLALMGGILDAMNHWENVMIP